MADMTLLLNRLIDAVPGARSAVLLSVDGLPKYWVGLDDDDKDTLAALASSMCSLSYQVGTRFGDSGSSGFRQVVTELGDIMLFVSAASAGSALAVLAGREVDPRIMGYEIEMLVKQVPDHLTTPNRVPGSDVHNGSR
ncbi:roadblock/LC7 domain-containing protein [Saccharomonospora iraqiensis]|uniref:roadblock/LC7 domain-containing protein n=1 Tax=Saccharomonospora iraqiensis TaxID=52698 RepID=UPI000418FDBD|nr:roadblock/LC7 domain-containing protein [Saccharomonospora iraqiensis]